jgi:hypothetical protein
MIKRIASWVIIQCFALPCVGFASAEGLDITVVNTKNVGVLSVIVATKNGEEITVGTTSQSGKLLQNRYKCDSDRNLVAKPIDKNYYQSFPAPCLSPQKLLVMSRVTSAGNFSFYNFTKDVAFKDGTKGQITLNPSLTIYLRDVPTLQADNNQQKEGCEVNFDVKMEKQVFQLKEDEWTSVVKADENLSGFITSDNLGEKIKGRVFFDSNYPNRIILNDPCSKSAEKIVNIKAVVEAHIKDKISSDDALFGIIK